MGQQRMGQERLGLVLQAQPGGRVLLEPFGQANVAMKTLRRWIVVRLSADDVLGNSITGGGRNSTGTQAVACDAGDVHAGAGRGTLDDVTDRIPMQSGR
jgi:hypothetical protein